MFQVCCLPKVQSMSSGRWNRLINRGSSLWGIVLCNRCHNNVCGSCWSEIQHISCRKFRLMLDNLLLLNVTWWCLLQVSVHLRELPWWRFFVIEGIFRDSWCTCDFFFKTTLLCLWWSFVWTQWRNNFISASFILYCTLLKLWSLYWSKFFYSRSRSWPWYLLRSFLWWYWLRTVSRI